eukprot:5109885-Alexandrium_andersonii.AAC.1
MGGANQLKSCSKLFKAALGSLLFGMATAVRHARTKKAHPARVGGTVCVQGCGSLLGDLSRDEEAHAGLPLRARDPEA